MISDETKPADLDYFKLHLDIKIFDKLYLQYYSFLKNLFYTYNQD